MSDQRDEDRGLVHELLDIEKGLTEWEVEFTESLSRWLETHETLTEKQRVKADEILMQKGS